MSSLPQVLHEAAHRSASEIVIESGQPPMIRTSAGSVTMGDALTQGDLFEALAQVLAPEQQAELAVGNVVEFNMDVDNGRWTMITEPSSDGITVRGRLRDGGRSSVEVGRPLDLPPLEPVEPERADRAPRTPSPVLKRARRRTQFDLGVGEGAEKKEDEARPTTPHGTPVLEDDAGEPDFELRTPTGEHPATLVDAHEPEPGFDAHASSDALPELVVPDLTAADAPEEPELDLEPVTEAVSFERYGRSLQPGTLCLVQGNGHGEELAAHVDGGQYHLIDDPDPDGELRAAAEAPPGGTFVLRVEDPSACLGWMLRRLEEGARIVVETRARTLAGARRTLLGIGATARVEQWLAAHAVCWLARTKRGGWTMQE